MDTINVIVRTIVFTALVLWWPNGAVVAFSTAQISAVLVYAVCYYLYFAKYLDEKRSKRVSSSKGFQQSTTTEDDFPFICIKDFLPHKLENQVRY